MAKTKIRQTTFSSVGNLTFYDGWSPNYVYFKTLYNAGTQYNENSTWDPDQAEAIAQQAINDAKSHKFLVNNSLEDSNEYFAQRFTGNKGIIALLEKAYAYEKNNEKAWAAAKIREINLNTEKYKEDIPALKKLCDLIKQAENGNIDFSVLTTTINVILQSFKTTQTTLNYEEKRVIEAKTIFEKTLNSRRNQAAGLARFKRKSIEEQNISGEKAAQKLLNNITVEYSNTKGDLTGSYQVSVQNKQGEEVSKTKYNIFGGKQYSQIKGTIDSIIKNWAEMTIKTVLQNPQVISYIMQQIGNNIQSIDVSSNLTAIEQSIKNIIILAILQYGMNNLTTLLDQTLNEATIQQVEYDLVNNHKLFDIIATLNLNADNLTNEDLGYSIAEPELLQATQNFTQLYNNSSKELYTTIEQAISLMSDKELEESAIKKILDNPNSSNRDFLKTQEIIELIHSIEHIQEELNQLEEEYQATKKKITKKIYLPQNTKKAITISIVNGQVKIQQNQLINAIKHTEAFEYMSFKSFSPSTLGSTISVLKRKASNNLKSDIINSLKSGIYDTNPTELMAELRAELQKIEVNMTGIPINKLLSNIQFQRHGNNLIAYNKNSSDNIISIEFKYQDLIQALNTKLMQQKSKSQKKRDLYIANRYTQAQQEFYKQFQFEIERTIATCQRQSKSEYKSMIPKLLKTSNDWNKKTRAISNILDKYGKQYVELLDQYLPQKKGKKEIDRASQFITNFIDNSFYISNTITSANTYVNQLGFVSNKLGTNLTEQLTNISNIFESAGLKIPKSELKWIEFAILNCFNGSIVGTDNKGAIENYLGSLMVFALFDEGGAEAAYLSDFYKKFFDSLNNTTIHSPKILHLYKVDGMYIPGSIVIQRTLNTLKKEILPAIEQKIPETIKRGAGITIINNINESIIPNRPIKEHIYQQNSNAWQTAGDNAKQQVQIKILFLAGLLDIINSMNKTINSLELPA